MAGFISALQLGQQSSEQATSLDSLIGNVIEFGASPLYLRMAKYTQSPSSSLILPKPICIDSVVCEAIDDVAHD